MNRNQNSRFAVNPTSIDISRSIFKRPQDIKLTGNVGEIIPFYIDEILPGDTHQIKTSKVIRLQTPATPFMDNLYADTYYFFVPNRLVWAHWKNFMGENTASAWIPETEYTVPQITAPSGGWNTGTIADYFGIPTGVGNLSVNALPFRAYALIINEWFRSEVVSDPLYIPVDETTVTGSNGDTYVNDVAKGGKPYIACKYADYFTTALPSPQKGADVQIPIASSTSGNLPVVTDATASNYIGETYSSDDIMHMAIINPSAGQTAWQTDTTNNYTMNIGKGDAVWKTGGSGESGYWLPDNLVAKGAISLEIGSINELRLAFQMQKLLEKDARGGTRYIEMLKTHFGVTSPDARLQRPEYLGGVRIPINVSQVVQSSATSSSQYLGKTGAMSLTADTHFDLKRSFVEHGFIIGVMVLRYDHTYQQGIERMWSRTTRYNYYFPVLANIGEQGIKNKEIYAQGSTTLNPDTGKAYDEELFGYQEAWAEYRYKPNRTCGEMRSTYDSSLDSWHLGDYYNSLPNLSCSWLMEDKTNVDRVLTVASSISNQFFADIFVEDTSTRPMPMYSIPGLIDHH